MYYSRFTYTLIAFLLLCFIAHPVLAKDQEILIEIKCPDQATVTKLMRLQFDITGRTGLTYRAVVDKAELADLRQQGFQVNILVPDLRKQTAQLKAQMAKDFVLHSYTETTAILNQLANDYSHICRLYNLGTSVNGRTIWGLKITNNPAVEENEAEVRLCGNHHGNELYSMELMLDMAVYLCEQYGTAPTVTNLVNNREIWVMPMVNPDGHEANSRYNANSVDLNRNYGYHWSYGGSAYFSEPETRAIRDNALENYFTLSLSFHNTETKINYVWNFSPNATPDEALIIQLSNGYEALGNHYEVTNGWDWYETHGDTNDWSYGCRGDIDWTIETPSNNYDNVWLDNRDATLYIVEQGGYGLEGVVTDAQTSAPVPAIIWLDDPHWPVYADPAVGDYHRPLLAGSYDVTITANNYQSQTFTNVSVGTNSVTTLNAQLTKNYHSYAYGVIACEIPDPYDNYQNNTHANSAIGEPDRVPASLSNGGNIILDMGPGTPIIDEQGDDFTVHEATLGDGDEGYSVYASNDYDGPWTLVGNGSGTATFDLSGTGFASVQYLKIVDDGNSSPTGANPGFDLDAITTREPEAGCGILSLDSQMYRCDQQIIVTVFDTGENADPNSVEMLNAFIDSDADVQQTITLTESGADTGEFFATVQLDDSGSGSGALQVVHGDTVVCIYHDDGCQGSSRRLVTTAAIDCQAPVLQDITFQNVTEKSADVHLQFDEDCTGVLKYGVQLPLIKEIIFTTANQETTLELNDLNECTVYRVAVEMTDALGNSGTDDNQGTYYSFATLEKSFLLFESMDSDPGWSVSGQWAFGQPTGGGGEYGYPDPSAGYTGANVYGYNLYGDYANNLSTAYYLTTTPIDCIGASNVRLGFWRWLGVESSSYDHANIQVSNNGTNWTTVWQNSGTMEAGSWDYVEYDISAVADNQSQVRVRWGMGPSDGGWRYCGWNIDDVSIYALAQCLPQDTPTPELTSTFTPIETPQTTPTPTPTAISCEAMQAYISWNSFGMPKAPVDSLTASTFVEKLLYDYNITVSFVAAWQAGSWKVYNYPLPFNNFDMAAENGYFYLVSANPGNWAFCGLDFSEPQAVQLSTGWNFVNLRCYPGMVTYNAQDVVASIGDQNGLVTNVAAWSGSGWQIYQEGLPFNNFTLDCKHGYFIRAEQPSTWMP